MNKNHQVVFLKPKEVILSYNEWNPLGIDPEIDEEEEEELND